MSAKKSAGKAQRGQGEFGLRPKKNPKLVCMGANERG